MCRKTSTNCILADGLVAILILHTYGFFHKLLESANFVDETCTIITELRIETGGFCTN